MLNTVIPAYIGLSIVTENSIVQTLPGFESNSKVTPKEIDLNYYHLFRLMSKKNDVTRQKALVDFTTEITTKETTDSIKLILQFWPTIYKQVANDKATDVRLAAQKAQFAIATVSRKNLIKSMRQIAPIWIKSRFDIDEETALVALNSFNDIFPTAQKFKAVLHFCENEFLEMIFKNLIEREE